MTNTDNPTIDEDLQEDMQNQIPPVVQKFSKFGNNGFQNGSKFGKPSAVQPQLKQRPGRAAARGR